MTPPDDWPFPTLVPVDPAVTLPPPVMGTATPDPNLTSRERVDRFWQGIDDVDCMGMAAPESIDEVAEWADLIVVGRATGAQGWPDGPYTGWGPEFLVTVKVSDVIKGTPTLQAPGAIAVEVGVGDAPIGTVADIDHLLLLSVLTGDDRVYYPTAGFMSVFANVGGRVVAPEYAAIKRIYHNSIFTTDLDGTSFQGLVQHLRSGSAVHASEQRVLAHGGYFAC
jgi:hypothetical protein